ncbi:MAG: hypothetical protein U5J96_19785 [Ignavibacteriaceae bacterium]|nr:hypothetical protein [Ignavibacteriaceae bacterium]
MDGLNPDENLYYSMVLNIDLIYQFVPGQSLIQFQSGTTIEVFWCRLFADNVTIQGTYTCIGTLCNGPLPVELTLFIATLNKEKINFYLKTKQKLITMALMLSEKSMRRNGLKLPSFRDTETPVSTK